MGVAALMTMRVSCDTEGCTTSEEFQVAADWNIATVEECELPDGWAQEAAGVHATFTGQLFPVFRTYCPNCVRNARKRKLQATLLTSLEEEGFEEARDRARAGVLEETMAEGLQCRDTLRRVHEPDAGDPRAHVDPEEPHYPGE